MKLLMKILLSLAIATLLGCANQFAVMRDANRAALVKVDVGMSKPEVLAIMGQGFAEDRFEGRYDNPFKRETLKGIDGKNYDVLYYYTQQIGDKPIESGLTPIVFDSGRVSGIGWSYLDTIVGNSSTTTIRRR